MSTSRTTDKPLTNAAAPPSGIDAAAAERAEMWWSGLLGRRNYYILPLVQSAGAVVITAVAVLIAYLLIHRWPESLGHVSGITGRMAAFVRTPLAPEFRPYAAFLVLSPLIHWAAFQRVRIFRPRHGAIVPFASTKTIIKGTLYGSGIVALLGLSYSGANLGPDFPVMFFVYQGLIVGFGMLLFHSGTLIVLLIAHQAGLGLTRVAVIGAGDAANALAQTFRAPGSPYRFAGVVALQDADARGDLPQVGALDRLPELINEHNLDELVVAVEQSDLAPEQRLEIAQTCWRLGVELKMVAPFYPFFHTSMHPQDVGGVPLLHVEKVGLYARWPQTAKRAMDILIAGSVLLVTAPILLAAMLAIKLDSPGPVFFVQTRVGLNGRTFRMLKLRSMRADSDEKLHQEYLQQLIRHGQADSVDEHGNPVYKMARDPRITRVGRFIRKTSIDELPQLINVLRGEMSLVGPRPSIPYEVAEYEDWHLRRLNIRPGITGLWQVSGRSRLTYEQMIQLDIQYVEQWSLWLDWVILVRTIPVVLKIGQSY